MTVWDTIIVGGGPAGAAAAYDLAVQGKSVLVLEKKDFPRIKPCAGGLTIKALARLRFPVAHLIHGQADVLNVGYGSRTRRLSADGGICAFTVREDFDHYCLDKALDAGATLLKCDGLAGISESDGSVTLTTRSGETHTGRFLIGADGAHSQVRRLTGEFVPDRQAFAIEGLLPGSAVPREHVGLSKTMTLDFGAQPLGYGWLFPKRDHVNVGLYTYAPKASPVSRERLQDYARQRLGSAEFTALCGYPIATGGELYRPRRQRVLLVGDAAGMAEAMLGEGIHNAIASGQAAAQAIVGSWSSPGQTPQLFSRLLDPIKKDALLSRRLAPWFYRFLPISCRALVRYPVAPVLMNGFAAGKTLKECQQAFARFSTVFERSPVPGLELE